MDNSYDFAVPIFGNRVKITINQGNLAVKVFPLKAFIL